MKVIGCTVDLDPDEGPTDCVFDNDEPIDNCTMAIRLSAKGLGKESCTYWREGEAPDDPVEQYKAGLVEWLKSEMIDNEYSQWDAAIRFVLEHIEADNEKVD